jgi:antitoxin (DNA-binding transcriptional repressor) of toxin-antitoxin stability system
MSAAFEVSPDDPQKVAEAIRQAADGTTVHLVRDGRPIADIVPPGPIETDADRDALGHAIEQRMAARFGAPSLLDYRRIYDSQGWDWPGEEALRRTHTVADAS